MFTLSPRIGVFSARSNVNASTGEAGLGPPVDCTTRCQGTSWPCRLITAPTARPDPRPTNSATSPYDMTLPRGMRSTTASTSAAYGVGGPPWIGLVASPAEMLAVCLGTDQYVGRLGSTWVAQAVTPPCTCTASLKPAALTAASASAERTPVRQ